MKKIIFVSTLIIVLLGFFHLSYAEKIYQWVDDNGVMHFTNDPNKVDRDVRVSITEEVIPSTYRRDEKRAIKPEIRNNIKGLDKYLINKKAIDFNEQIKKLDRAHKQRINDLEFDLNQKRLDLENAKRGLQKIDYSKTNWNMFKRWNDKHHVEIRACEKEIRDIEAAIEAEKRNYIAEKIILEEDLRP